MRRGKRKEGSERRNGVNGEETEVGRRREGEERRALDN